MYYVNGVFFLIVCEPDLLLLLPFLPIDCCALWLYDCERWLRRLLHISNVKLLVKTNKSFQLQLITCPFNQLRVDPLQSNDAKKNQYSTLTFIRLLVFKSVLLLHSNRFTWFARRSTDLRNRQKVEVLFQFTLRLYSIFSINHNFARLNRHHHFRSPFGKNSIQFIFISIDHVKSFCLIRIVQQAFTVTANLNRIEHETWNLLEWIGQKIAANFYPNFGDDMTGSRPNSL